MTIKVHVTGSSGFIGRNIMNSLDRHILSGSSRKKNHINKFSHYVVDWSSSNSSSYKFDDNIDVMINCCGLAHTPNKKILEKQNFIINSDSALNALRCAHFNGAKKFIQISSIAVYDSDQEKTYIDENSITKPNTFYGQSKLEAEKRLQVESLKLGIELVIIRPALVVGSPLRGNLKSLTRYLSYGLPFFYFNKNNIRSLITINSLISLINLVILDKKKKSLILIASNSNTISTYEIAKNISLGLKRNNMFIKLPNFLYVLLKKSNFNSLIHKIYGDLKISSKKISNDYNWDPKDDIKLTLQRSAETFIKNYE
mgnify:CR=1 FL=1|tara:strand:+ start:181 stop:1119 length:939 start_codon:yes stop_codon:yes gene_type:complete